MNNVEAMKKERNQIFYDEVDKIINRTIKDYVQKTVFDDKDKENGTIFVVHF